MDYEAAFLRERTARKRAESILEEKSRELHLLNQTLNDNVESLELALRENKFLMHIGRYGLEKPRLRDFLPTIVKDMLRLSDVPFAVYFHFPFDSSQADYRSDLLRNEKNLNTGTASIARSDLDLLACEIEEKVRETRRTHFQTVAVTIDNVTIDTVVALPIISLDYLGGIIILFSQGLTSRQQKEIDMFRAGMKQLAIMMEHRYQEDKLLASYKDIKVANEALKETQKKLVQSEKMATVGQLSAGIAHEINNPMGFIKSNMGTLSGYVDDFVEYVMASKSLVDQALLRDDSLSESAKALETLWQNVDMAFLLEDSKSLLDESQHGVKRILDIVGGLKRFSRQSDHQKEQCNIVSIIDEALNMAHNELKYKGKVIKQIETVQPVMGKSGELLQVFLNLFVNASHAMNEQGKLTVSVEDKENGVQINVADNGSGIDPKHLDSIFNPFFTTKEVGVGTGLGLSISYGIVEEHNGTIDVTSELGVGTVFSIWLPYPDSSTATSE
ncbi:sensor histidine kinase [Marinomonas spartinae]|uniref:sensor histidine kinase n=1 Tax=Marinomonas spartinae TaxID=1792290 RepID=UPI0018F162BA|nr:ATP-binding protein [Marinomonas spartinae]MBJ7554627.1 hypothetical protein [Marinomonas spartinae]